MLKKAKQAVQKENHTAEFVLLTQSSLPAKYKEHFDFIYSFDVMPHLDLHTIWKVRLQSHFDNTTIIFYNATFVVNLLRRYLLRSHTIARQY
jgi:hypothetical protein